jgi:branched-chain amino acid transport system substrate-binding protein
MKGFSVRRLFVFWIALIGASHMVAPLAEAKPKARGPASRSAQTAPLDVQDARGPLSAETHGETLLEEASAAFHSGDIERTRRLANQILESSDPLSRDFRSAQYLIRRLDAPPITAKIVVVLPLSDARYSAVAQQVKEAFSLGYKQAAGTAPLHFKDSGSDSESVTLAIENAVLQQGAMLVVGPLLSAQAIPAAETAEALRVPLLTISRALEDASAFHFVFQATPTVADEVEALLGRVMDVEMRTTFASFAPDTPYGRHAVALFTEGVEARGGAVTVSDFFPPEATDMLVDAQRLGRKDYEERAMEFRKIKRDIAESGGDPSKAVLPPVIDFQALFLPDRASRVPLACAALAFEEFPLGDFQPVADAERIPMLGLSGWNHPSLVNSGGPYVRGSLFVDAFITPAKGSLWTLDPFAQAFVDMYRETFQRTPSTFEAVVSDAARLIALATLADGSEPHRFIESLMATSLEQSVTGALQLDPVTHHLRRDLKVLSLDANHLLLVDPPSDAPEHAPEPTP